MFATRTAARKIPGLVPGIFFLALAGLAWGARGEGAGLRLSRELYAEGDWAGARAEGLRAQGEEEGAAGKAAARLAAARAALKLGKGRAEAKEELAGVWRDAGAEEVDRCAAAYELGLAEWADGNRAAAFPALERAFLESREIAAFLRAGCSLYFFMKEDGKLRKERPGLWQALRSCRDAWPGEVWRECRPGRRGGGEGWGAQPGRWIVRFYRAQVGPAIGSRCDLRPSCSEYFLQSSRKHGLLGIPIMADRFVREPSVVSAKEKPVETKDGRIRYADPVEDHDFWLGGKR